MIKLLLDISEVGADLRDKNGQTLSQVVVEEHDAVIVRQYFIESI